MLSKESNAGGITIPNFKPYYRVIAMAPVAHTCSPSYSRGRNQEDHGSKPAQANSLQNPISKKKKITKKGWQNGSRCRP
jgi:hypothetical protein